VRKEKAMSNQLFSFQATTYESNRLHRLLRQATKQKEGAQEKLNVYTRVLFNRYGYEDPESYQITIIGNMIVIEDYPSFDEILAAHRAQEGGSHE
jgi:hypothetical protein